MKSRIFIASTVLTLTALMAACNHNMSSDPIKNYPELAQLSVPKTGDEEARETQETRTTNEVSFKVDSSMVFYEGSEKSYQAVVKISGNNVAYNVKAVNLPSWAQLIEPTAPDQGVRTFLIKGTPKDNHIGPTGFKIYQDVRLEVEITSYGNDPIERSINSKALYGAELQRPFTIHAIKANVVQQPVIGVVKSLDLDESSSPVQFTVSVTSAGGTPRLEAHEVNGQTCLYNSERHVSIGAAQAHSDGKTYLFPVTFNPANVELTNDLKACQKSATIKSAFALVATDAKNVPSLPVAVNARIKRQVSLDFAVAKKYTFPAGQKTTQTFVVSTRLGTLNFDAQKHVKVITAATKGTQPKFEKCNVTADKTTATCTISWNPHCQNAETVKVSLQAQSLLNANAIETIKDYEVELVSEIPGTCKPAPTASAAPTAGAGSTTAPTATTAIVTTSTGGKPKSLGDVVLQAAPRKAPVPPVSPASNAKVGVKK